MTKAFASTGDLTDKTITFAEVGLDLYTFTTEGDPNSGVIIGDDSVMVIDTQATPVMAQQVVERVRGVTDKPIKYVTLSHYHAVRVLGAAAYDASEIIASEKCRAMIQERGQEDWASEYARMPRLFIDPQSIPGLTWPTMTFPERMTVYLGRRRVEVLHLGRAHTAGDVVVWVPDSKVLFSGDTVEYEAACYCGDAHLRDWPATLERISELAPRKLLPGRGDSLQSPAAAREAIELTRDFLSTLRESVSESAARGRSLKEAFERCREVSDPKFAHFAIYEHVLPFNVARAYDEANGIEWPRIWTAERDREMWASLQD